MQKSLKSLPHEPKLLKSHTYTVTSDSGANLGPISQCHLTFESGNKSFKENFIALKDVCGNLILALNWLSNYRISCSWNVDGHQYITYNKYLWSSIPSTDTKPIIYNAGAFYIQPRGLSKNKEFKHLVKHTTHLCTQCQWWSTYRSYSFSSWPIKTINAPMH